MIIGLYDIFSFLRVMEIRVITKDYRILLSFLDFTLICINTKMLIGGIKAIQKDS